MYKAFKKIWVAHLTLLRKDMLRKVNSVIDVMRHVGNLVFSHIPEYHIAMNLKDRWNKSSIFHPISYEHDGWIAMNSFRQIKGAGVKDQKGEMLNKCCILMHKE